MAFKILIVDDLKENLQALDESLKDLNANLVFANSGLEALEHLSQDQDFCLALIDVHMPDMSGFELANFMRGVEKTKYIPIIFVTANTYSTDFEFAGYDLGAVDFIFKPINVRILKSKVSVFQMLNDKQSILDEKIKELEATSRELEISRQKAVEADHTKSVFLANMSHEIRTPLTALIGFAEILHSKKVSEELCKEYSQIIVRNGKHLIELVNEVLDLSKIEAEQLTVDIASISVHALLDEVINLLQPLAKKTNVNLTLEISEEVPKFVQTDKLRFRQIVTNIVNNGIKFSPDGEVKIKVFCEPSSNNHQSLKISVEDTGIGIAAEHFELLFQPFSQIKTESTDLIAGTGLGLALSKKLASLLGGDVVLERSELNSGSHFVFSLPIEEKIQNILVPSYDTKDEVQHEKLNLGGLRTLVVDDSIDNQILLKTVLTQYGADVLLADRGDTAVEVALANDIDIVLMDYKMPGLDGFQAISQLRKMNFQSPIILLTANAMKGEKERALSAGGDAYISKPIDWNVLLSQMVRLTHKQLMIAGDPS